MNSWYLLANDRVASVDVWWRKKHRALRLDSTANTSTHRRGWPSGMCVCVSQRVEPKLNTPLSRVPALCFHRVAGIATLLTTNRARLSLKRYYKPCPPEMGTRLYATKKNYEQNIIYEMWNNRFSVAQRILPFPGFIYVQCLAFQHSVALHSNALQWCWSVPKVYASSSSSSSNPLNSCSCFWIRAKRKQFRGMNKEWARTFCFSMDINRCSAEVIILLVWHWANDIEYSAFAFAMPHFWTYLRLVYFSSPIINQILSRLLERFSRVWIMVCHLDWHLFRYCVWFTRNHRKMLLTSASARVCASVCI